MENTSPETIKKHVRTYIAVFAALAALTVVTVAVSYLHLPTSAAIVVALIVASIKASLVICYFMHLLNEQKTLYFILILTALFFLIILIVPAISHL